MPSASTNNNNKNKLMKQASFGCSSGGGGGPGGSTPATVQAAKSVVANAATNVSIVTSAAAAATATAMAAAEINNTKTNSGSNNTETIINSESGVCSNNALISTTGKGTNDNGAGNPMRQALITIEHKIRNLEKRKTKLESYRLIQANGKELSSDQKAAVAKYDAVMATLDFARDLSKQMVQFAKDAEKDQKKQSRKDLIAKAQSETAKIREVLIIQNILSCFSDESVRSDFMNGENGAIKLDLPDLEALDQFCFDIQTRRPESVNDPSFISVTQKVAEYFSMTIDGRPKQYGETTFENLRRVFNQIQECGYFDKIYLNMSESSNVNEEELGTATGELGTTGVDDNNTRVSNSREDNIEKVNVNETGLNPNTRCSPIGANYVDQNELNHVDQSQQIGKEHPQLDHLPKPTNFINNAMTMPTPSALPTAAAPLIAGVPHFTASMPPPNRQRSGTTTPVHVTTIYASQPGGPPQPQAVTQQMQQVVPPPAAAAAMISGLPPQQQPNQVTIAPQHRPNAASGVSLQLPPGVSAGIAAPMHAGPTPPGAPFHLTTVCAVEQDFFKQHQHQQQQKFVQQMRPLAEVIGAGSFYFLQDSELDSPDIINGGSNNSGGNSGPVFEASTPNMLVHVPGDMPLSGTAIDIQQQQKSKKHAAQAQQQQPPIQSQPIPTQTFTNQTFPPIQPQPPTQLRQRHEVAGASTTAAIITAGGGAPIVGVNKTPTMNSTSNGNTPTTQLYQQVPTQQGPQSKAASAGTATIYSPDIVIANKDVVQQQQQMQQQPIMIMTRLATPQARLPLQAAANVPQQQSQQQPQQVSHAGFPFDPIVASFGGYEKVQQQLAAANTGTQKLPANGIQNIEDKKRKTSGASDPADCAPAASDWEVTIKGHPASRSTVNNNAAKAAALTSALKQHSSGASAGGTGNPNALESGTNNKWSTEMNALNARGTTPPAANSHQNSNSNNNSSQGRKNEWSNSNNGNGGGGSNSYGNDVVSTHSDNTSNHWNSNQAQPQQQQQHESNTGGGSAGGGGGGGSGYGRSGSGRNSNNAYQRRSDDRRGGDRSAGGGGGGGGGNSSYRNRNNNSYGGSQSQQNGGGRGGGGGGMYFRNNEGSQSGAANSFYQNGGGIYAKDGNTGGSRYDNGGNSYRGPRSGGNTNQRNQGPPRSIGRNAGTGTNNSASGNGGGSGTGTGSGFMNPRQTNRMSIGLEKN